MCRLEEPPKAPLASLVQEADTVDGALEDVLEEVVTEQVKQRLWECVIAVLQRGVQWCVDHLWRRRDV